jgi:hypothetical protein
MVDEELKEADPETTSNYNAEVMKIAGIEFVGVRSYSIVMLLAIALLLSIIFGSMNETLTLLASNVIMFYLGSKTAIAAK